MGRAWHRGKRVSAQAGATRFGHYRSRADMPTLYSYFLQREERVQVILIRHGQTEFNRVFSVARRDPGIRDPNLTDLGRRQAAAAARVIRSLHPARLITSPYVRTLETSEIIAQHLDLPITIEPLIAERFSFICDIGSPLAELRARWPNLFFDHLRDPWWPQTEETEEGILSRSETFRGRIASEVWSEIAVVTHWGFIRALTGLKVPNGAVLRIDGQQTARRWTALTAGKHENAAPARRVSGTGCAEAVRAADRDAVHALVAGLIA